MKALTMTKETMANAKKQALLLRNRHIARKSSLVIVSPKIIRFKDEGALQRKTAYEKPCRSANAQQAGAVIWVRTSQIVDERRGTTAAMLAFFAQGRTLRDPCGVASTTRASPALRRPSRTLPAVTPVPVHDGARHFGSSLAEGVSEPLVVAFDSAVVFFRFQKPCHGLDFDDGSFAFGERQRGNSQETTEKNGEESRGALLED